MSLKQTRFSGVADFFQDRNGTVDFSSRQDFSQPTSFGTCGLHPDEFAIANETPNACDEYCDRLKINGESRILEHLFWKALTPAQVKISRMNWLEECVSEYFRTGIIPWDAMKVTEQRFVMLKIDHIKEGRRRRSKYIHFPSGGPACRDISPAVPDGPAVPSGPKPDGLIL